MAIAFLALISGLIILVWSADRFVDGSASVARHFGMPPLLIGMIIVGFGTSAPEMVVSALAALSGNTGIALGNAYGSNICNIALILGITALINPIVVQLGGAAQGVADSHSHYPVEHCADCRSRIDPLRRRDSSGRLLRPHGGQSFKG